MRHADPLYAGLHRAEPAIPTPLPSGPDFCATPGCGTWLEPLRRTAGLCQPCVGKRYTLQRMPDKPAPYPEVPVQRSARIQARTDVPRFMRPCWACGEPFAAKTSKQICCSHECTAARRSQVERERRGYVKIIGSPAQCTVCGGAFTLRTANRRTCSDGCARELQRKFAREYQRGQAAARLRSKAMGV